MRPYTAKHPEALEVRRPSFTIDPRTALSFSLVLHELALNAVRYGALSTQMSRVRIEWGTSEENGREVHLTWRESGGPHVSPPGRSRFGTRLVYRVFEYELGGDSTLEFPEDNLRVEARFPLG
jgi:two-component sensor histidine kinase